MENHTSDYRVEKDSIGTKDVPANVYYGVQSLRAAENFPITGLRMNPELIRSLAYIKKAAALTNLEAGLLNERIANAIVRACDEILAGKLREQFIVDPVQGGAGTSINMNANEVIANRAIELLGGVKGDYSLVNPNDHVNCGQSTNDVIPTAGKMTTLRLLKKLETELDRLRAAFEDKSREFNHVIKMGRTQMQDAVPIRLGQEFRAYADAVRRDTVRMGKAMDEMRSLNMGGTAIGTGINADETYLRRIVPVLSEVSGMELTQAGDLIVTCRVQPHEFFERDGDDLHGRANVSFIQAILGAEIEIDGIMPDEKVQVRIPAGCQNEQVVRVKGFGMPRLKSDIRGNMYVHVNVIIPEKITKKQRELLEKLADEMGEEVAAPRSPLQKLRDAFN